MGNLRVDQSQLSRLSPLFLYQFNFDLKLWKMKVVFARGMFDISMFANHIYLPQTLPFTLHRWRFFPKLVLILYETWCLLQFPSTFQDNDTLGQLGHGDWNDVVLPAIASELFTQQMSYVFRGLEPGAQYEARVQARNRFGWNQLSDKFQFSTRGTGRCLSGSFASTLSLLMILQLGMRPLLHHQSSPANYIPLCAIIHVIPRLYCRGGETHPARNDCFYFLYVPNANRFVCVCLYVYLLSKENYFVYKLFSSRTEKTLADNVDDPDSPAFSGE